MLPGMVWAKARPGKKGGQEGRKDIECGYSTFGESEKCSRVGWHLVPGHPDHILGLNWMSYLDDDTPLSALTIPGTHDSAAFTYSWPFVATQKMNIQDQLNAGIRYFDLRCGIRRDIVEMVHGTAFLGLTLHEVLNTMYKWLDGHSSEALIVQIKRDRKEEKATVQFAQAVFKIISEKSERWRTSNRRAPLGALRGRIQLFRRFEGPNLDAYGMDVTEWVDNPSKPFTIYTRHGVQVTIQDHYKFADPESLPSLISKKGGDVAGLLDLACHDEDVNHWYINFTSAFEFNFYYQLTPREVAVGGWWGFTWEDGMNVRLRSYLTEKTGKKQRFGIVAMDFPELGTDDLITALIQSNFEGGEDSFWTSKVVWLLLVLLIAFILTGLWTILRSKYYFLETQ